MQKLHPNEELGDIIRKWERGWCWRDRLSEETQSALTLSNLEDSLSKPRETETLLRELLALGWDRVSS